MKVLFLEPFFGGSHRDFAKGFVEHSRHEVDLVTLPARFWKWRMRGAALEFFRQVPDVSKYDAVFATDMMDVSDFLALAGPDRPPLLLYFHENQLSYPLAPREKRDFHLGFTNIISARAADRVLFNSQFHLDDFYTAARRLIKQMPDFRPARILDEIRKKTDVVYPGCRFPASGDLAEPFETAEPVGKGDPPLIVWNHRWEYDKDPELFFRVLGRLKRKGIRFSLAVLGEKYDLYPDVFDRAGQDFSDEIRTFGYAESRREYQSWLARGSIVVSTAIQENFGISVVEAVRFGCFPLLPSRLSYPEIMPRDLHGEIFYQDEKKLTEKNLTEKLKNHLVSPEKFFRARRELSRHVQRFSWEILVNQYDNILENLIINP